MSIGTAIFLVGALAVAVTLVPDFLAHVSRYRARRRWDCGASRGGCWKVTR